MFLQEAEELEPVADEYVNTIRYPASLSCLSLIAFFASDKLRTTLSALSPLSPPLLNARGHGKERELFCSIYSCSCVSFDSLCEVKLANSFASQGNQNIGQACNIFLLITLDTACCWCWCESNCWQASSRQICWCNCWESLTCLSSIAIFASDELAMTLGCSITLLSFDQ